MKASLDFVYILRAFSGVRIMPIKSRIRTVPHYPKQGIMFRDITTLLGSARAFRRAVDELVQPWAGSKIDKVAGIEARGFIIGGAIAHQVSSGFVPIRKKGKLPHTCVSMEYALEYGTDIIEIHVDALKPGEKVIVARKGASPSGEYYVDGAHIDPQYEALAERILKGECPPGTTETRPQTCQAPSEPAPSILDYRPRSTLVTAEHKVPKAKFPVIDVHSHQGQLTADSMKELVSTMDPLNVRVLTLADNLSGDRLVQTVAAINASPYKDRFRALAGIDFRNVGPGWADKAIAQLRADIKAGALGVGEVGKQFGLRITKPDGSRLHVDDPEIDPLWDEFAKLDVPVNYSRNGIFCQRSCTLLC